MQVIVKDSTAVPVERATEFPSEIFARWALDYATQLGIDTSQAALEKKIIRWTPPEDLTVTIDMDLWQISAKVGNKTYNIPLPV